MPLRRNRWQYEQLTDFVLKQVGRIGRHLGRSDISCSVLATVDHSVPSRRVRTHPVPSRDKETTDRIGLRSHVRKHTDHIIGSVDWIFADLGQLGVLETCSDESRFSLSADDHRTRVWRRTGQRTDPAFIVERHTAQGVTIWDTRSSLVVLRHFDSFMDDILTPIVLPMISSRPGAIFNRIMLVHILRDSPNNGQGYDVLPEVTRSIANRSCLEPLGRQLQPSRDTGELTAQMQKWQDLPQGVIILDATPNFGLYKRWL
ncbi:DDE_3 domain-containing protein [Trichonephila clavipes]|nr:DDE_3 domain-containing protein [Trichonephila clavipes]